MAKYVIFKTEVPHFKKEGGNGEKTNWQLWLEKAAAVAQATGAYELENNKKG